MRGVGTLAGAEAISAQTACQLDLVLNAAILQHAALQSVRRQKWTAVMVRGRAVPADVSKKK